MTYYVGQSYTLKATTTPSATVKWSTSNKSVATVSTNGWVKMVKAGTTTITAQFTYKGVTYKKTCKVTVKTPSVKLNKTTASITKGKSVTLKATLTPSSGGTVKWTSSNKKIATVTSKGVVKGIKKGTATITCTYTYRNKTYKKTCKVTVK